REASALTGVTAGTVTEATAGNGASFSGAVYVFARSDTTWSQQAYVKASNSEANDDFGLPLALSGDGNTLVVGARSEDSALTGVTAGSVNEASAGNGAFRSGAVYVFTRSGSAWSQQAYVKASNTEAVDSFASSVALSSDGNTLAVGASNESSALTGIISGAVNEATAGNAASQAGAVYIFARAGTTWSQQAYVKASNTEAFDSSASAVPSTSDGISAAVALQEASAATGIGGDQADNSASAAGAVYLY